MAQAQKQSAPKGSSGIVRRNNIFLTVANMITTGVVSILSFIAPPVAAIINHTVDRITNGIKATREEKARMEWLRPQIARTLGMPDPRKVTVSDYRKACQINPQLAASRADVARTKAKDNRESTIFNAATLFIPGAEAVEGATKAVKFMAGAATIGKQMAVTTAGGLLMDWASKKHLNAMEVAEGISSQLNAAHEQGRDPHEVVTPQMLFLLRVSQDQGLEDEIHRRYNKPFQKMNEQEQSQVMLDYKPLADAVTSEAHSIAVGNLPVQELLANAPNLKSSYAAKYREGAQNGSFVDNLNAQRALAAQAMNRGRLN